MANPFSTELHNWFWAKDFGISGFFMLVVVVVGLFIFFVVVTNPINYLDPFFHLLIHPFHPFFLYFNFICFILPVILVPFINDLNSFFPSLFFELLFVLVLEHRCESFVKIGNLFSAGWVFLVFVLGILVIDRLQDILHTQ